jgi:hypothetical protein
MTSAGFGKPLTMTLVAGVAVYAGNPPTSRSCWVLRSGHGGFNELSLDSFE